MRIKETGYYKTSELKDKNIFIGDNINVFIFDNSNILENIYLGTNSKVEYYSSFFDDGIYNKNIIINGEKSKVKVRSLIYSEKNNLKIRLFGNIKNDFSIIDMKTLSFAGKDGNISLDGILKIDSKTKQTQGYLNEENIFLGDNAKISGIPTLFVETNDVVANHSCSMEKISDENLFYLRSRGIKKEDSLRMIIKSKKRSLFKCLEMVDKKLFDDLITL